MGEIKLNRPAVEGKHRQITAAVNQIEALESQPIDAQKAMEMAEKMQNIAAEWQQVMTSYQDVVNQHLALSEAALDSLEEKERQAAKGIEMLK
ncbi:DUF5344 family protein [Oceanobacillus sp. CFH 90083]|uniref:DUF5344 family protein n=1 Tax=Oceanobacillus sp. CFH 90083 TaxID=2592336 RepID=UPI00128E816B|nr:DUF5344 family protein [Oceanobacillus sp. CFH 90083]